MATFQHMGKTLHILNCGQCKTTFAMEDAVYQAAHFRAGEMAFHCPNGHPRVFMSQKQIDEFERARQERDRLKQKVAELEDDARRAMNSAERAKKEVARIKKRVEGGVCPCCDRTFANLAAHMRSKHKGAKAAKSEAAKHKAEA